VRRDNSEMKKRGCNCRGSAYIATMWIKSSPIFTYVLLLQAVTSIVASKPTAKMAFMINPGNERPRESTSSGRVVSPPARSSSRFLEKWAGRQEDDVGSSQSLVSGSGLYKQFADHAWEKLEASGLFQDASLPTELEYNQAPAKGIDDSIVQISTKALIPSEKYQKLVRYARVALLETIPNAEQEDSSEVTHTKGIQVLNLVVIPSDSTSLPVLGIDLVSLPGNRHLLLLDAQPMTQPNPFEDRWEKWHSNHVKNNPNFPWGGDFPEPVQQYVSKYALWTRLQDSEDPVSIIQSDVWDAFVGHLDVYLDLLTNCDLDKVQGPNHQPGYLKYRRDNDPAKPMLNSLYGPEWTNQVLDEVLFPQNQ
jgi:hypothetical protein